MTATDENDEPAPIRTFADAVHKRIVDANASKHRRTITDTPPADDSWPATFGRLIRPQQDNDPDNDDGPPAAA